MKRFLIKSVLFSLPIVALLLLEGLLPVTTFTYRPWESLLFSSNEDFVFYPNQHIKMQSYGELRVHTELAIPKDEEWFTDRLGYRNRSVVADPDILIIGDSFITGVALTQDSTMPEQLMDILGKNTSVYSIAPAEFDSFITLLKNGTLEKPRLLIYSIVERHMPPTRSQLGSFEDEPDNYEVSYTDIFMDKVNRRYSKEFVNSILKRIKGPGIPGVKESGMYFLNGYKQEYSQDYAKEAFASIVGYKTFCDSIGVDFLFLPMPNKETVYFDYVPFEDQPQGLLRLDSMLTTAGIKSINSLAIYNEYRRQNPSLLYHLDDSHWNSRGVNLIAQEVARIYTQQGFISSRDE